MNSLHHQAVFKLGDGLQASAISEDGLIEALEWKNDPFLLGVQWHPEHTFRKQEMSQRIFHAFVDACIG